jgi:hypothetical protein
LSSGPIGPTGSVSSVTFGTVAATGATNISLDPGCPTVPSGMLVAGGNGACMSEVVTTTAAYSGGVSVCIPLPTPAPSGNISVLQCDANPSSQPCPVSGIDSRLTQATTDPQGNSLCCGYVTNSITTAPGADPICFTTSSLSLFAIVGQTATVPAMGWLPWLLASSLVLMSGLVLLRRRGALP